MPEAYIVDAVRSPVGKKNGGLAHVHPADLGAHSIRALGEAFGVAHTTIGRGANAPSDARQAEQKGDHAGANAPPGGAVNGRRRQYEEPHSKI